MNTIHDFHQFYSLLSDDISKRIYMFRVLYAISDEKKWIKEIVKETSEGKYFYNLPRGKCDYIFGCGTYGFLTYAYFDNEWCGFVDNNYLKYPDGLFGLEVINPSRLPKNARVFLCVKYHEREIKEQLLEMGIKEENIVNVGKMLQDIANRQYFDLPYLKCGSEEVFADCGALNGDTAIGFKQWCNGTFKHIYCFEPDKYNVEQCKKRLQDIQGGYSVIPKAVYDKKGTIEFSVCKNGNSNIVVEQNKNRDYVSYQEIGDHIRSVGEKMLVETTSLDSELLGANVTFIKMDVEGAELKALMGAEKIIKSQKPKLAISLYHSAEDVYTIPSYLMSLRQDYKYYLRHYSLFDTETVLYAI